VNSPVSPILTLEPSEKGGQIGNLRSKLPQCENLVKIGPVDPEFSLLRSLF